MAALRRCLSAEFPALPLAARHYRYLVLLGPAPFGPGQANRESGQP